MSNNRLAIVFVMMTLILGTIPSAVSVVNQNDHLPDIAAHDSTVTNFEINSTATTAKGTNSETDKTSDAMKCKQCLTMRIECNIKGSHSSKYCDKEYRECLGGVTPPDNYSKLIKISDDLRSNHCLKIRTICNIAPDNCDQKYLDCMGRD